MSSREWRVAISLGGVFGLRMLGLFLVLPVFAQLGQGLQGSTPALIGLALGIYGLSQALLQIPFGWLSDRVGRKPVIVGGLVLFAMGSLVAAYSDSMIGVILGRALQGSGAIAAAVLALAADLSREEQRTKVMAIIGVTIGASFMLSLMLGPSLGAWLGLSGLFALTGVLGAGGILMILFAVPTPARQSDARRVSSADFAAVLRHAALLRLNMGIFVLHAVITAAFLVLPGMMQGTLNLGLSEHWRVYIPVLLASVVVMGPIIGLSEKRGVIHRATAGMVAVLAVALAVVAQFGDGPVGLLLGMWLFFTAFNLLEASLPSMVSRLAPAAIKGTALGVYATAQFMGAFTGGALGGLLLAALGEVGVLWFAAGLVGAWFVLALGMTPVAKRAPGAP